MPHSSSAVKTRLEGTIACLTPALEVLNELHDTLGLPFAPVIASTLASLIVKLQTARRNTEECLKLTQNIHELIYGIIAMYVKSEAGGMLSPTTLYDLAKFTETLHKIHTFVEAQQDGSKIKNFFRQGQMNTLLKECRIGLEQAQEVFKFETGLTTVTSSHQMATRIQLLHDELVELISTLPDTSVSDKASSMYTLGSTNSSKSVHLLPANPQIFHGREAELQQVVECLLLGPARIAILGPGGMGKTSLARAVVHHPDINIKYERKIFIAADSAPNSLELAAIIGSHLGLKPAMDLTKPVVQHCLRGPSCLLILDNLETPWEPLESRGAVEEFLSLLTDIGHLALIITMRGAERPARVNWTRPFLQALTPLSAVAARKTFFDIADNFHDSEDIDSLLLLTDNMPLAIDLIAHLVNYEGCSSVLKRWETEKGALFSEGSDKTSSLHASLEMSMSSPRLGNFPGARHLLSLLSILPDGLWDSDLLQSKLPIQNLLGCKAALRSTSLAYVDNNNRLKCLAPIREYMLLAYPPSPTLVQPLAKHFSLLMELYEENTGIQLKEVTERIHSNFSNLQQMLQQQLVPDNPTLAEAIRCAIRFSSFSRVSGHGRTLCMKHLPAILSEFGNHSLEALFIIEIFRSGNYYPIPDVQLLVNKGIAQLYHLNDTVLECDFYGAVGLYHCFWRSDTVIGMPFLRKELALARTSGAPRQECRALDHIALIEWRVGEYFLARKHTIEAQMIARLSANLFEEAKALQTEGLCRRELGDYTESIERLQRARELLGLCGMTGSTMDYSLMASQAEVHLLKSEFAEARYIHTQIVQSTTAEGNPYGHAWALLNMAEIAIPTDGAESDVRQNLDKAVTIFSSLSYSSAVTHTDVILGDLELRQGNFLIAQTLLRRACALSWGKDPQTVNYALDRLGDVRRWKSAASSETAVWAVIYLGYSLKFKRKLAVYNAISFLGEVFISEGDATTANELFIVALQAFTCMDVHRSKAYCMLRLGDIAQRRGDSQKALELWKQARPLFEQSLQNNELIEIDSRLARVTKKIPATRGDEIAV